MLLSGFLLLALPALPSLINVDAAFIHWTDGDEQRPHSKVVFLDAAAASRSSRRWNEVAIFHHVGSEESASREIATQSDGKGFVLCRACTLTQG
jgi:hypothetical protein